MEVLELYNLTDWVNEKVTPNAEPDSGEDLFNKYDVLIDAMQNSQRGQTPFEFERETLEYALEAINFLSLTRNQMDFLEKTKMLQVLGQPAIERMKDILTRSGLDIASATEKIQEMRNNLEQGFDKLNAIRVGLEDYIPDDYDTTYYEDGVLTRLSFCEDASINNIVDFKKAANDWNLIGRGLAEISNVKPEDIKIIGASRGSIIFDLLLTYPVAKHLNLIISCVLNNIKTYYEIKEISSRIKGVEIDNKIKSEILKHLNESEDDEKTKIIEQTVKQIIKDQKVDESKSAGLQKAVEKLSVFLEKGGHIDFVLPPQEDTEESTKHEKSLSIFREQIQQTKILNEEVRRIRYQSEGNTDHNAEQSNAGQGQN